MNQQLKVENLLSMEPAQYNYLLDWICILIDVHFTTVSLNHRPLLVDIAKSIRSQIAVLAHLKVLNGFNSTIGSHVTNVYSVETMDID